MTLAIGDSLECHSHSDRSLIDRQPTQFQLYICYLNMDHHAIHHELDLFSDVN